MTILRLQAQLPEILMSIRLARCKGGYTPSCIFYIFRMQTEVAAIEPKKYEKRNLKSLTQAELDGIFGPGKTSPEQIVQLQEKIQQKAKLTHDEEFVVQKIGDLALHEGLEAQAFKVRRANELTRWQRQFPDAITKQEKDVLDELRKALAGTSKAQDTVSEMKAAQKKDTDKHKSLPQ